MAIKQRFHIVSILKNENVRLMDGRFSDGFVDIDKLNKLIKDGVAEIYDNQGVEFVRLAPIIEWRE